MQERVNDGYLKTHFSYFFHLFKIGKNNNFFIYLFTILKFSIYIKNKLMQGMTFSKSMLINFFTNFIAFEK